MKTRMDFSRLETTLEQLQNMVGEPEQLIPERLLTDALYYLEYLQDSLADRTAYHKKHNAVQKLRLKEIKRLLSADELREIDRRARISIGDVTPEDLAEINRNGNEEEE